jgi:hypothetical protein
MNEIWKDIPGYEGLYQVSSMGDVRSRRRVLKPCVDKFYLCVSLHKDKKQKKATIHQLVILAFTGEKSNHEYTIDHVNSDKHDNRLENLRLIKHRENASKDRTSNTGYTGVYLYKKRYYSAIRIDGVKKHLGVFDTPEKAYDAYKKELNEL